MYEVECCDVFKYFNMLLQRWVYSCANDVQVNETFAAQFLAVQKVLGLDVGKTNISGGALAMGNPFGASGSRITANLVHEIVLVQC